MRRMVDFVSIGDVSTGPPSGTLQVCPQHADDAALVVIGCQKDTQTADLFQLWTSAGSPVMCANASGVIYATAWAIANSSVDTGSGFLYANVVTATNISATTNMFAATITATNISGVTRVNATRIYATEITATNISGATNVHTTTVTATRIDVTTDINAAKLTATNISGATNVFTNVLTATNISGVTNVKADNVYATVITATNISGATNVHTTTATATRIDVTVDINAAKLTATNISGATNVFTNVLTATNISGVTNLKADNIYAASLTATSITGVTNLYTSVLEVTTQLSSNGSVVYTKTQNGGTMTSTRVVGVSATHDATAITAAYIPVAAGKTVMVNMNIATYCSAGALLSSGGGYNVTATIVGTGAATAPNTVIATTVVPLTGTVLGLQTCLPAFTAGGAAAVAGITFTGSATNDITWAYDYTYITI